MSIEREIKKTADDIHDRVDEAAHRTVAEGEKATRRVAGDQMTPGEKAKSMVNQLKHEVEADVDKSKRKIRENT